MRFPRPFAVGCALASVVGLLTSLTVLTAPPPSAEAAAPAAVPARIAGHPVWAHFTHPPLHDGRDATIHDEVVRLIDAAPAGSTIRGTIYSLTVQRVASALVAAERRGVRVLVLLDGKNEASRSPAVAIIKQLRSVKFCGYDALAYGSPKRSGGGCVSTSDDGDLHVKMFTFTQTTDPNGAARSDASWFSSANMTYASGSDQFNNAVTVYGDAALAGGLNSYFTDLWNRRHYPSDDYYNAALGRGYYPAPTATVYASPEKRGQTDTVVTRLDDLTPDSRCQVRVSMSFVTDGRPQLLRLLKDFKAKGCRVWMAVGTSRGGIRMPRSVYSDLLTAGVGIRRVDDVHDKLFTVYGRFGRGYEHRVYTGSQNWSGSALTSNDEIFVKMAPEIGARHPLFDAFSQHFQDAWAVGRTCTASTYPCR